MRKLQDLNWFVLLAGLAGLVILIVGQKGDPTAQLFGIGVAALVIFYFLRFERELVRELTRKTLQKFRPSQHKRKKTMDIAIEDRDKDLFSKKFPKIRKIPVLKTLVRWMHAEGWFYSITLIVISILFLSFGLNHLGKFMSVDEPKWLNTRVPQFYEALLSGEWQDTYINDKPGVLPSSLAGVTNFFLDKEDYGPNTFERFLFWWRFPILLFNFLSLFLIYRFTKRLLNRDYALLATGLIALHPIIIGISQIVNPDATLWSTSILSFITFFLYLKTNQQRYILYSGVFLGLALLSKYFVALFYVTFLLAVYLEYLLHKTDHAALFRRFWGLGKIYLVSIVTYTLLFPATWVQLQQILDGTIGANILNPGRTIILLFLAFIIFELVALRGKITEFVRKKLDISTLSIRLLSVGLLFAVVLLLFNLFLQYQFFDPQHYKFFTYERGEAQFIPTLLTSGYVVLFTLTMPLLVGLLSFLAVQLRGKVNALKSHNLLSLTLLLTIIMFIVGAALGGFAINARYQIILYPLYALLSALLFISLFRHKKTVILILLVASTVAVVYSRPFYLHYTNFLNIYDTTTMSTWGYGGYELAQVANSTILSENSVVWSDREGFNRFYLGESYWRGKDNPFSGVFYPDYLVLSNGGERRFTRALKRWNKGGRDRYAREAGNTPILEYYKKEPLIRLCIHDNVNHCVWIVEVDKSDLPNLVSNIEAL